MPNPSRSARAEERTQSASRGRAGAGPRLAPGRDAPAGGEKLPDRARRLVALARTRKKALILTHDNPDPDSIATALALAQIFREKADLESTVAYGGIIGRAENRALLKVLKLPVVPLSRVVFDEHDFVVICDTQPEMGNHSLPSRYFPDAIFDHHPERPESRLAAVAEVGGVYGATSTIAVEYMRALGVKPTREVATALFYGIKADTRDLGRETEDVDVKAYLWLFPMVDKDALAQIEHPRLPANYFRLFHTAIERCRVYGHSVVTDLGEIYSPDMVAEVAERHLFLEGIKWSLALAIYEDNLFLSLRTNDRRMNAGRLIREVVEEMGGTAGGHGQMAGARIPVARMGKAEREQFKARLLDRFREEWGVADKPGIPLLEYGKPE